MKKTVFLIGFLLNTALSFGAISLVQSNAGGSISSSGSGPNPGTFTTSAVGFSSTTTAGNTIVVVVYGSAQQTGGQIIASLSLGTPSTPPGVTWSNLRAPVGYNSPTGVKEGLTEIFFMVGAPAVSTTITASATVLPNTTTTYNVQCEFELYEFNGLRTSSPGDGSVAAQGSNSVPNPGNQTATTEDLLMASYTSDPSLGGSNVTAGSGYTLGINATVSTFGQFQWKDATAGANATAFGGSTPSSWGAMTTALKAASGAGSGVSRHRGLVF